jgi:hypothetical protein
MMFRVLRAFYLPGRDLVVLTGSVLEGELHDESWVDLPRHLGGPGWVRVNSVESVRYADGNEDLALTLAMDALAPVPMFEPSLLEGRVLALRR